MYIYIYKMPVSADPFYFVTPLFIKARRYEVFVSLRAAKAHYSTSVDRFPGGMHGKMMA